MRLDELKWEQWNDYREFAVLPGDIWVYRDINGKKNYRFWSGNPEGLRGDNAEILYQHLDAIEAQCILYELLKE